MFRRKTKAFTLIELLTVIVVILILAGLILAVAGYVQGNAARSRATSEISALSAACESYKADNGVYPMASGTTDAVYAIASGNAASGKYDPTQAVYTNSSKYLYGQLSGDYDNNNPAAATNYDGKIDGNETSNKIYFEFKPNMLGGTKDANGNFTAVTYIQDPFGYSYGYSTAYTATSGTNGYNPTFDLWSTGGTNSQQTSTSGTVPQAKWIKNW